jgi:hypothetical protein
MDQIDGRDVEAVNSGKCGSPYNNELEYGFCTCHIQGGSAKLEK